MVRQFADIKLGETDDHMPGRKSKANTAQNAGIQSKIAHLRGARSVCGDPPLARDYEKDIFAVLDKRFEPLYRKSFKKQISANYVIIHTFGCF